MEEKNDFLCKMAEIFIACGDTFEKSSATVNRTAFDFVEYS